MEGDEPALEREIRTRGELESEQKTTDSEENKEHLRSSSYRMSEHELKEAKQYILYN